MANLKHQSDSKIASQTFSPIASGVKPLNVGVCVSRTNRNVRIFDRNQVFEDILMQGEDMNQFLQELKQAHIDKRDLPIGDVIASIAAPFVASKWC